MKVVVFMHHGFISCLFFSIDHFCFLGRTMEDRCVRLEPPRESVHTSTIKGYKMIRFTLMQKNA